MYRSGTIPGTVHCVDVVVVAQACQCFFCAASTNPFLCHSHRLLWFCHPDGLCRLVGILYIIVPTVDYHNSLVLRCRASMFLKLPAARCYQKATKRKADSCCAADAFPTISLQSTRRIDRLLCMNECNGTRYYTVPEIFARSIQAAALALDMALARRRGDEATTNTYSSCPFVFTPPYGQLHKRSVLDVPGHPTPRAV
jgi:hypothetical protein